MKMCCIDCKHIGIFYSSELGKPICGVDGKIIKTDTEKENNCKYFEEAE